MEKIINNPGLQHLAENIFLNLNYSDLKKCQLINQSTSQILNNPMFWIKELIRKGLSQENQKDWINAVQLETNSEKKKSIAAYLKWNLKEKKLFDVPCFNKPIVQEYFRMKICNISHEEESSDENTEIVKILAPLTDNPNSPHKDGRNPIYWAAFRGHTEIVKILAPLTDNPNAPNKFGDTPIHNAAKHGCTEIVKILALLTENPNFPNKYGNTPILWAARNGDTEIVKILVPLTDKPNNPNRGGETPEYWAARNGHTEIVKILAPMTDNHSDRPVKSKSNLLRRQYCNATLIFRRAKAFSCFRNIN